MQVLFKWNGESLAAEFLQHPYYILKQFQDFTALQALPQSYFVVVVVFKKECSFNQVIFKHIIPTANASNLVLPKNKVQKQEKIYSRAQAPENVLFK